MIFEDDPDYDEGSYGSYADDYPDRYDDPDFYDFDDADGRADGAFYDHYHDGG